MSVPRRISAFLDLADADIDAALLLAGAGNRYAAYHCQQAVEKLIKAIHLHLGKEAGIEHRLDVLIGSLPDADPWRSRLEPFGAYTMYATTFRYPRPAGRLYDPPDPRQVSLDCQEIRKLVASARSSLR